MNELPILLYKENYKRRNKWYLRSTFLSSKIKFSVLMKTCDWLQFTHFGHNSYEGSLNCANHFMASLLSKFQYLLFITAKIVA